MKQRLTGGFTLIELLVVIAIIGILSSFIVASLGESRGQARDAERLNDLKQLQVALELYYNRNREYPSSLDGLLAANNDQNADYMSIIPVDPRSGDAYEYTANGNSYAIRATSDDESQQCQVQVGSGSSFSGTDECPFY